MLARRVKAVISLNNEDITKSLTPHIKSISYSDHMSGSADDLQFTLEDKAGQMISALPQRGDFVDATLFAEHWENMPASLRLGTFELDEVTYSGYPTEMQLKAVSIPFDNTLRGEEHTRSWEKAELKTIANDIATAAKLTLLYDTEDNPTLDRVEQSEQSDLSFLLQLCTDNGLALKVTDNQLVVFDEAKYEQAEAKITIVKPGMPYVANAGKMVRITDILSYSLGVKTRDVFAACHVKYQESKDKAVIEATFTVPDKKGRTLQVNEEVKSIPEAERLAKKRLREKNREEFTGDFSVVGNFNLVAGVTANLIGFGALDGKYIITQADHSIGSGYTTRINVRRCLDGY